jgi:hypothetical protein
MDINELQVKIRVMEKELQQLKDIEAIRKLQHSYGFYLTTWMNKEIIDLFSDSPETRIDFPQGIFTGKAGVEKAFGHINKNMDPEFLHQLMQLQGVIDIDTNGETAKGRWWAFGAMAMPAAELLEKTANAAGILENLACGIYENEYIKENGVWKIWKLKWVPLYSCTPATGWVNPEKLTNRLPANQQPPGYPDWWRPDIPAKAIDYAYPSGYILPFHYKHPVTGKASTESKRNTLVMGGKKAGKQR